MGRPRSFDEEAVTRAAVALFAGRAYDGLSVDDLVTGLGVHRNSLYKTFGSKRGLYLTALKWYLRNELAPLLEGAPTTGALLQEGAKLDLLLLAAAEQAPHDAEVGALVAAALGRVDAVLGPDAANQLLGLRLRARINTGE
ncbi:TetR/AcrR family transcriptional regulator [Dactylosporangium vinaceum]|uniref:TetR/AcrR family transcriptional regulator n=1 Tax=Dactylosporangium vinaceum TaxID=53362 RepID=A0ABV5MC02_9ACTN|nr:TetR/AcrR family transcriptional regulator [Dactylosporangium vinaceum]UAC01353.1 TetR/AcrR family transcriptional regulator [Dactylosporangium vinaceum]